ncbi:DNA-methyltransferase [Rhodococcus erythropolis]|uniref:DNA-methyltransferase n=1 Tax=Rhodococcus erythropolis TaxID=1833 RepID=UPI0022B43C5E|nr:site-specific DNA-methyltransferase [Rhodococcus erythropolis]
MVESAPQLPDIKPRSVVASLDRSAWIDSAATLPVDTVAPLVGMAPAFIKRVLGSRRELTPVDVLALLDQDAYRETFVRRSQVMDYLFGTAVDDADEDEVVGDIDGHLLLEGNVLDVLPRLASSSVQCVVTSTPYWGMRIYKESKVVSWADGESCAYGHEQTPEGFVRHTTEILFRLKRVLVEDGSIWWNLMDSYNTRTQIRGNAAEALRAMQGKDSKGWADHDARRYSAGHSYLKDGEQCMIPSMVAERASLIGYFVKSVITWAKTSSMPEPQNSRVSRGVEYIIHMSTTRTPKFDKEAYRRVQPALGGRNAGLEADRLSDFWVMPTSSGRNGHGAAFPTALPGRCIALSTDVNDVVLDPFVGSGTAGVSARALGRKFIGVDISPQYLAAADEAISSVPGSGFEFGATAVQELPMTGML